MVDLWHHFSETVQPRVMDAVKAWTLILYVDYVLTLPSVSLNISWTKKYNRITSKSRTYTGFPAQMDFSCCTVKGGVALTWKRDSLMDYSHPEDDPKIASSSACSKPAPSVPLFPLDSGMWLSKCIALWDRSSTSMLSKSVLLIEKSRSLLTGSCSKTRFLILWCF